MNFAILGLGNRGVVNCNCFFDAGVPLVAVCDKKQENLDYARRRYGVAEKDCYLSDYEFFKKGRLADLLIIATGDRDHYANAIDALNAGYDILLEKPIADSYERCLEIYNLAEKLHRKIFVCHVLRYAPFFNVLKRELDSGKYGDVVTVNMTENVAFWHQAHSYVRGLWGRVEKSTPMLLAKCCHDLDIISWFMGKKTCKSVSSFGSLDYFKRENAPEGSADYCFECKYKDSCVYDAQKFYQKSRAWFVCVPYDMRTPENISALLADKNCPYGRCVWKCDNTAVDHQVVNMLFEGGATAHLTMTAFSADCYREIHVHCTKGNIYGNAEDGILHCRVFGGEKNDIDTGKYVLKGFSGHGGGDALLVSDIIEAVDGKKSGALTSIADSLESHCIGYAAEKSRLEGGIPVPVDLKIKL